MGSRVKVAGGVGASGVAVGTSGGDVLVGKIVAVSVGIGDGDDVADGGGNVGNSGVGGSGVADGTVRSVAVGGSDVSVGSTKGVGELAIVGSGVPVGSGVLVGRDVLVGKGGGVTVLLPSMAAAVAVAISGSTGGCVGNAKPVGVGVAAVGGGGLPACPLGRTNATIASTRATTNIKLSSR